MLSLTDDRPLSVGLYTKLHYKTTGWIVIGLYYIVVYMSIALFILQQAQ